MRQSLGLWLKASLNYPLHKLKIKISLMIHIKAWLADSKFHRFKGLMFQKKTKPLYLETRFGIHTLFLKDAILVLVLDRKFVIQRKKIIEPWRLFLWNPRHFRILELPADYKSVSKIKIGDKVKLELVER